MQPQPPGYSSSPFGMAQQQQQAGGGPPQTSPFGPGGPTMANGNSRGSGGMGGSMMAPPPPPMGGGIQYQQQQGSVSPPMGPPGVGGGGQFGMPPPPQGGMGQQPPPPPTMGGMSPGGYGQQGGGGPSFQGPGSFMNQGPPVPAAFGGQADFTNQQGGSSGGGMQPQPNQLLSGGFGGAQTEARDEQRMADSVEFSSPPHFVRGSVSKFPNSLSVRSKTKMPIGIYFQPLAPVPAGCPEVPTVNFNAVGVSTVVRCKRCRSYINPFVIWDQNGRKWQCNMCGYVGDTPQTYYCHLDDTMRRADRYERPELVNGSVDFIAPAEYMVRPPQPPVFMFLLESTYQAVASGALATAAAAIKELIENRSFPGGERALVGIMTYDSSIHFYNLNSRLSQPQMLVVSDLEDPFLPLPDDILVPAQECETQLSQLLTSLPEMFQQSRSNESCLAAAVRAAWMAMKHVGGKLIICASTIPSVGPSALKSTKENLRLLNTDKEIDMLKPTMEGFKELAGELTRVQITAELFIATSMYMDLASIAPLARYTGGDIRYYPGFRADVSGEKLRAELQHVCTRDMGWEAVMRVRVSKGWKITNFYGHMFVRSRDLLVVPNCHEDQTFSITLEPDADGNSGAGGGGPVDPFVCVQCALLFTSSNGERRIRVHTIQLPTTGNIDEVLDTTDPEVATGLMASLACDKAMEANSKLSDARNLIQSTISQIVSSTPSHIEAVRPLPLHVLGLLKSPMFRATSDVPSDQRIYYWTRHESISVPLQAALFYPRMFAVHQLTGDEGTEDPNTHRIVLPHSIALSAENMTGDGIYLQEDGESILMWIGKAASPHLLHSLFNIPSLDQLRVEFGEGCLVNESPDNTCQRVLSIIDQLRLDRSPPMMQLILVPQGNQYEVRFFSNLIEDKTIGMQMSYQEFLHRIGGANQPRGTPHNASLAPQAMMPGPGPSQMMGSHGGAPMPPPPSGMYGADQQAGKHMPSMPPMGQAPMAPPPMGAQGRPGPPPMGQPPMGNTYR